MGMDALSVFNTVLQQQRNGVDELRPSVDLSSAGVRLTDISATVMSEAAPVASTGTDVRELPQSPADPRWRYRIPPPACARCGKDHQPNQSYNHPYDDGSPKEAPMIEAYPVNGATEFVPVVKMDGGPPRRVAVYVGRGDSFVLKVEENPPEWDDVLSRRMTREQVLLIKPILKALGIKWKDNTGGELEDDELAEDRPKPAPSPRLSGEGFEAACRELGLDPQKVRAVGLTGSSGPDPGGWAPAASGEQGDGAADQE